MFVTKFLSSYFQGSKLYLPYRARATDRFTSPYWGIAMDQGWHSSARLPNCKQKKLRWAFGSFVTLILPFWGKQWRAVSRIDWDVEMAAQMVEEAADVVGKVSVMAEKASEEMAEKLPEDSKLRNTVMLVERVSKEAAAEAHLAKDIIHKVKDLKEEVEALLNPTKVPQKLKDMDKNY